MREYRKGNWTESETMILIEAKKMDDERRLTKRISSSGSNIDQNTNDQSSSRSGKPAELRWKWVEDYCWSKGCMRSQNQCNDKWDNLMRDYKKVRDHERKIAVEGSSTSSSYWNIEKNERKERNLPTNMLPQIYKAIVEVVEKKAQQRVNVMAMTATTTTTCSSLLVVPPSSSSSPNIVSYVHHHHHHQLPPPPLMLQQHHMISSAPPSVPAAALPLPSPHNIAAAAPILPPTQTQPLALRYSHPFPTMCDSSDSDTSEHPKSPAKRRRRGSGGGGEGTSTGTASAATTRTTSDHQVASAISKSASIIAEALEACEEREDTRHRDVLSLHERKIKIEESKIEINRLGINGLVDAINNLANSIQALASQKNNNNNNNQSAPK